uniref:Uncharacterized protein n=1 Tax=Fagus sylvatica TaxID=28930 RepID=A0A2N9IB11_FAGSY
MEESVQIGGQRFGGGSGRLHKGLNQTNPRTGDFKGAMSRSEADDGQRWWSCSWMMASAGDRRTQAGREATRWRWLTGLVPLAGNQAAFGGSQGGSWWLSHFHGSQFHL